MRILVAFSAIAMCGISMSADQIIYPVAPEDATVDNYFGISVPDPYRPLENDTSAVTRQWVEEENEVTRKYLDRIPFRSAIHNRLTHLFDYKKTGLPEKIGDYYYYFENNGLQNQSVLYRSRELGGDGEIFIDPNKLSDDGTVALKGVFTSHGDGKLTAYTISRSGSDWEEIYVMDSATGNLLPDHIVWAKFTGAEWDRNGDGFYYSTYPVPEQGKEFSNSNENHLIYYHRIGTPQSADKLVYSDPQHPFHFHTAYMPESNDLIFVYGAGEGLGSSLIMKDISRSDNEWITIEPSQDYDIRVLDVVDGTIYILTNYGAPKYRVMTASLKSPRREDWKELIPESDDVLVDVSFSGSDKLVLNYMHNATSRIALYSVAGTKISDITLPGIGTVAVSASRKQPEILYSFTSFTVPMSIYRYDSATGNSALYRTTEIEGFDPDDYVTEQVYYSSADGTRIPMFIVYKKGLERNGKNPVYLYGYGGFNISLNPGFSSQRLLWLENGGIYAQPSLRGGGEYGEPWHLGGIKTNKLNVFNDFISAAEYMIKEGWTSPDMLTIEGGSNGGLLVGATVNMRPDLFKVAIPRVGVMDMMRYHLFTIGWNWASDYGTSADSKEMAEYLLGYSPLHTISNDGTTYPAILVTTADHDDRVVPAHSFKYAATLQASDTGSAPKLIRIDSKAGHGGGKPIAKVIDEYTDIYSFIFYNIGVTPECADK